MKAWEEIGAETPEFPIRGKVYKVPELGYRAMLTLQKIKAGLATDLDNADAEESWRLVMGSAWDEMVADDVPAEALSRAGLATLAFFEGGPELAEQIWEKGIDPKAILAALEQQQTAPPKPSSTAAASGTRSRASSSGTSSRPASPRKSRAKASPSAT